MAVPDSFDLHRRLADDGPCDVCYALLRPPPTSTQLDEKPLVSTIQISATLGCRFCKLVWRGISLVRPEAERWDDAVAFGQIIDADQGVSWLRVGLKLAQSKYHPGIPREWVDFTEFSSDFAAPDSAPSGKQSILTPNTSPWFERIAEWISACEYTHKQCARSIAPEFPTRLLDLDLEDGTLDIAIREGISHGETKYIALSYCWGTSQPLRTLSSNLDLYKTRIFWCDLPPLFQDVAAIARALGVQYIWIDSLCIVQEDERDWSCESAQMASYYGNAWLTIAAGATAGTHLSCFPRQRKEPVSIPHESLVPLFSRAWAYQERLISRRILHLGPEEMVWECSSEHLCECGMTPDIWNGRPEEGIPCFRSSHHDALVGGRAKQGYWDILVGMYLIRRLTFDSDRLKAIMGLAKQLKRSEGVRPTLGNYVLGLWSEALPLSLLWSAISPAEARNPGFPSWSWASIKGTWLYEQPPPTSTFTTQATVIKPQEIWDVEDCGNSTPHSLTVSGLAWRAVLKQNSRIRPEDSPTWSMVDVPPDDGMLIYVDVETSDMLEPRGIDVLCLNLGVSKAFSHRRNWGLILRRVQEEGKSYARIGIVSTSEGWNNEGFLYSDVEIE
ncbi:HET-domain-containing protein [Thozetella sp. PMI_491]|nr:HET-domain-containing protein [Thozetella sp. PMI_491]